MNANLKMELLNSEELKNLKGGTGATEFTAKCDKKGDVIACANDKLVACATSVLKCPSTFSSDCNDKKFTINGCEPSFRIII
jgi:hypothetical protein